MLGMQTDVDYSKIIVFFLVIRFDAINKGVECQTGAVCVFAKKK